jgi:signal transduction histidine kinase
MDLMMLGVADVMLIVATAAACTAGVVLLTLLALRANRRGPISSQFAIVLLGAVAAMVVSTSAVMGQMFVSPHDLAVFVWVVGVSAALSLTVGLFITRRTARAATAALVSSAREVGGGAVVTARAGWREFEQVSAQLAEASERLSEARAEIARLDAARRTFLAGVSHDLRTPLTAIRATAESLEDGMSDDPEAAGRLIRAKTDAIARMVDDLLQLSRIETDGLELRRESIDLLDVISDAVADVMPQARPREVRLVPDCPASHMLWADPGELGRAIGNLLSNAVRHAPRDSEVTVSATPTEDGQIAVSVRDRGDGVAEADLERIFEVGWRGSHSRGNDGAGFGLAIVRGIAHAHGGEVRAANRADGFEVTLLLPAAD